MSDPVGRREVFSNPFFVVLMLASVVFLVTILGYLVSPYILVPDPARPQPGANSVRLAEWFDRRGPLALAIEFAVMLVAGVLAMATDPWFSPSARARRAGDKR